MALNRCCVFPRGRTAGHLSGSDRAARCPTGKKARRGDDASRPRPVAGVNELVKYTDIDAHWRCANNLSMTIVEITGGMLRAARSLTGLSEQEFAERASN